MKACRDYSIVSDIAQKKLTGQNGKDDMTSDLSVINGSGNVQGQAGQKQLGLSRWTPVRWLEHICQVPIRCLRFA